MYQGKFSSKNRGKANADVKAAQVTPELTDEQLLESVIAETPAVQEAPVREKAAPAAKEMPALPEK